MDNPARVIFALKVLGLLIATLLLGILLHAIAVDVWKLNDFIMVSVPKSGIEEFLYGVMALISAAFFFVILRLLVVNRTTVPFWSRRSIMTGRAAFVVLLASLAGVGMFLSSQAAVSFGTGERNIVKNSFRFAGEHEGVVRALSTGLTEEQAALAASLPGKYSSAEAFALANTNTGKVTHGKGRKAKMVTTVKQTPAGMAVTTAATRAYRGILTGLNILVLIFIVATVKLLLLGHRAWLAYTAGKRNVMKLLNLVYYIGYLPLVLYYGFVHPFRDLPRTYGSPGGFARTQTFVRVCVAAALLFLALLVGYTGAMSVFGPAPAAQASGKEIVLLVVAFTLLGTGVVALTWARKAAKGYLAEKGVAGEVMDACLRARLPKAIRLTIYWGRKYAYSSRARDDIASRAGRFVKRILGKDDRDTADIDLSVRCTMHDGTEAWLVCEIKSHNAWNSVAALRQAAGNAELVEREENPLLAVPAVISPTPWNRRTAWFCMEEDPTPMTVKEMIVRFLSDWGQAWRTFGELVQSEQVQAGAGGASPLPSASLDAQRE